MPAGPHLKKSFLAMLFVLFSIAACRPGPARGCACGCGVFDVQTSAMLPTRPGGIAFLEYDFMNQNRNWSAGSRAPDGGNDDKQILTHLITAGAQYLFSRSWGAMAEVPYWHRRFKTADDGGSIHAFDHGALGDIRLSGIYSGFSPDMSSGLTFGIKLPSGDYTYPHFDRDTQIGTGSTDLLLGAYHMSRIADNGLWTWFASAQWDQPGLTAGGYRPGSEINGLAGVYYDLWRRGTVRFTPLAQLLGSVRWRDSGNGADSANTGYRRLLAAPGFEAAAGPVRSDVSVGFPVLQWVNGDQLVAQEFWRVSVSYAF